MDLDDEELYVTRKEKGLIREEKEPEEEIKDNIINYLNFECQEVMGKEFDINRKYIKMNILFNMKKIVDNYEQLEPILQEFFRNKARQEKWKEER